MINFCTLFDSNYLDKGIALIQSLNRYVQDFNIYIYAFDLKAFEVLRTKNISNVILILFEDIITSELESIRKNRTRAEFCWTCTPFIVEHTLDHYGACMCTYIDADLCFYADPQVLIDEMTDSGASVQVVEHRFPHNRRYREIEKGSGRYCVEFNTFVDNEKGRQVLRWWREQCFACCSGDWNTGSFGDQKYLEVWQEKFGEVNVLQNHGGGVAPWNIGRYVIEGNGYDGQIFFRERETKKEYQLVFFHFHDLHFVSKDKVDINIYLRHKKIDKKLVQAIYSGYVKALKEIRDDLSETFGCVFTETWQKDTCVFWKKDENPDFIEKIKKVVKCPSAAYRKYIVEKKDIICAR